MIRFEHVTKRYEDKDALSDLNLEICTDPKKLDI